MKMVKSLLLGSAAGVVAVAGAQAADLPVKAKPVEYVKICSLYGDGFYYIPGTDICMKFGGHVQADYGWNIDRRQHAALYGTRRLRRTARSVRTRPGTRATSTSTPARRRAYGTLRTFARLRIDNENDRHGRRRTCRAPSSSGRASPSVA